MPKTAENATETVTNGQSGGNGEPGKKKNKAGLSINYLISHDEVSQSF